MTYLGGPGLRRLRPCPVIRAPRSPSGPAGALRALGRGRPCERTPPGMCATTCPRRGLWSSPLPSRRPR
eukprot:2230312-Alexandrium_andersonii.AAC.1